MNQDFITRALRENPLVITGVGAISAAGNSASALWQSALAGLANGTHLSITAPGQDIAYAGCRVSDFALAADMRRVVRKMDRSVQLAACAAAEAWRDAQLTNGSLPPERIGIIAGTSRGPVEKSSEAHERLHQGPLLPSLAANTTLASLSGALSLCFHAQGPCFTVSAACASSAAATAAAAQQIVLGEADVMLVGGAEAPLIPGVLAQLDATGVLGSHAQPALCCRPFDQARNGTILGEGAGFLVLESLASAQRRGATPRAKLAGWAIASESHGRAGIREDGTGLNRVIRHALDLGGLTAADIGYLNAHGTGTVMNDRHEAEAIAAVFGKTSSLKCSSTKAVTGHCMGASSALEAIISIAALNAQLAPPSANLISQDERCPIQLVQGTSAAFAANAVLSTSSGFWGNNAALIFSRIS